jgi:hypothetical protein
VHSVFRKKNKAPSGMDAASTAGGGHQATSDHRAAHAARLATDLDASPPVPRQPVLTETEALVVVDLLEQLTEQPISEEMVDLARTLIVRILDRLEPTPHPRR